MLKKVFFVLLLIGVILFFAVKWFLDQTHLSPIVSHAILHTEEPQIKNTDGVTNILLLGIGGGVHDGPNLTDTIILASIDQKAKKVTLVSIPRDLWVPDLRAKINTAYSFGEDNGQGKGLILAKATVQKILNQPIDYAFRIDFSGFTKAVDLVGGLDLTVDRTFDDYAYPIEGKEDASCGHSDQEISDWSNEATPSSDLEFFPCRFMHLHVDKGPQHMDGTTALRYVRSRHALGPEGSDFSRSKRQQKIIAAFKDKVFSVQTLLNPAKLIDLYNTLKDSIDTDIKQDDYAGFVAVAQKMKSTKIESVSLDVGEGDRLGLLVNPPISPEFNNAWVLAPRTGGSDFSEVQQYVTCMLTKGNCIVTETGIGTPTPTPRSATMSATLSISPKTK
ncbi:MAG TPA: LCP family protein [Candidatus Saccharimonadales bacterium]|nr:LCP family protein [Candidatus Saccharimonadales bacterium]